MKTVQLRAAALCLLLVMILPVPSLLCAAQSGSVAAPAAASAIDADILLLMQQWGYTPEPLTGVNESGNRIPVAGVSFQIPEHQSYPLVRRLHGKLADRDLRIFIQEQGHGYLPDRIGIIRSQDPFDIVRVRRTHAYTAGLGSEQIIHRLRAWDKQYGLRMIGAGYNWIRAELQVLPDDLSRFSEELVAFCPDILQAYNGSVKRFEQQLRTHRSLALRWD